MSASHPTTVLRADELRVGYGRKALLPPVTFTAQTGELWAVAGPNGSGKSTLLKTMLGLLPPVSGTYTAPLRVGYVPQRSRLNGWIPGRVFDVVASGVDEGASFLKPHFLKTRRGAIADALALTLCTDLRNEPYAQLSEGQKQRVLIARAIVRSPQLLVLDEPTSAMDITAEHRVMHLLEEIRTNAGPTILLVSHHLAVVAEFATHLIVVDRDRNSVAAGTIDKVGANEIVQRRYGRLFLDAERHTDSHLAVLGGGDG